MNIKLEIFIRTVKENGIPTCTYYLKEVTDIPNYQPWIDIKNPEDYIYYQALPENIAANNGYMGYTSHVFIIELTLQQQDKQAFFNYLLKYLASQHRYLTRYFSDNKKVEKITSMAKEIAAFAYLIELTKRGCRNELKNLLETQKIACFSQLKQLVEIFSEEKIMPLLFDNPSLWIETLYLHDLLAFEGSFPNYANQMIKAVIEHHHLIKKFSEVQKVDLSSLSFKHCFELIMKEVLAIPGKSYLSKLLSEGMDLSLVGSFYPQYLKRLKHHLLSNPENFKKLCSTDADLKSYQNLFPDEPLFKLNSKDSSTSNASYFDRLLNFGVIPEPKHTVPLAQSELKKSYGNIQKALGFFRETMGNKSDSICTIINHLPMDIKVKIAAFTNDSNVYNEVEAEEIVLNCLNYS